MSKGKTIEEILALPDNEIDLSTAILIISKDAYDKLYHTKIDIEVYRQQLDAMATEVMKRIGNEKDPIKIIKLINAYLFLEQKYSFGETNRKIGDPKNLLLNSVMDRKKGNCLSLSILYLCIAERIGLPVYGVALRTHFFVRYSDKNISANIETIYWGVSYNNDYYYNMLKIPIGTPYYMKNLTRKEVIGNFYSNLSNTYSDMHMIDESISAGQMAKNIIPYDSGVHHNLGIHYQDKKMFDLAMKEFNRAIEIDPSYAQPHNGLGNVYTDLKMYNEALKEFAKAIELDPTYANPHNGSGTVYYHREMYKEALKEYNNAIELDPASADMHSNSGLAYSALEMYEEATREFKLAIEMDTTIATTHHNLGFVYYNQKRYKDAITEYRKAIELDPDDANCLYLLGWAIKMQGGYNWEEESTKYFNKAYELDNSLKQ